MAACCLGIVSRWVGAAEGGPGEMFGGEDMGRMNEEWRNALCVFSTEASPCACDSLVGINLSLGRSPLRSSEVIFSKKSVLAGFSY